MESDKGVIMVIVAELTERNIRVFASILCHLYLSLS